jgi:hypothetical protein
MSKKDMLLVSDENVDDTLISVDSIRSISFQESEGAFVAEGGVFHATIRIHGDDSTYVAAITTDEMNAMFNIYGMDGVE